MPTSGLNTTFTLILCTIIFSSTAGGTTIDSDQQSTLSGYAYVDENCDGVLDTQAEWLMPTLEIQLFREDATAPTATTQTDERGYYEFADLTIGLYKVSMTEIPTSYVNVMAVVGELMQTGDDAPADLSRGQAVLYDQQKNIMPGIANIELPATQTQATGYNFGMIWLGKAWFLTGTPHNWTPPSAVPPNPVPEPSTAGVLWVAGLLLYGQRKRRDSKGELKAVHIRVFH